jgi:hypothetical protein
MLLGMYVWVITLLKSLISLVLVLSSLLDSTKTSGSAGSNQTNLSSRWAFSANGGRLTNMLVITTTKGMLHGVHGHTTHPGPAVTLDSVLVVSTASLEERLVRTSSTGDDTNLCADSGRNSLLSTTGQTQTGSTLFVIVRDDDSKGSTSTSKGTTVSYLGLDVAHNSSFRNHVERQDVADGQRCLLSTVNKLSGVHTFSAYQEFIVTLVVVGVTELDLGNRGTSARVVDDFLHDTTNVSMLLSVVKRAKLHGALTSTRMRLKDRGLTLTLGLRVSILMVVTEYSTGGINRVRDMTRMMKRMLIAR